MFWDIYDRMKMVLCRHDWQKVSDKMMAIDDHYIVMRTKFQCSKCGKVTYR